MNTSPNPNSSSNPLLTQLSTATQAIYDNLDPHNPYVYLERGKIYAKLGFHDLAAADAYRALTLLESVFEPDIAEYVARRRRQHEKHPANETEADAEAEEDEDRFIDITRSEYDSIIGETYCLLVHSLSQCGCLRDAYEFHARAVEHLSELMNEKEHNNEGNDPEKTIGFSTTISQLKDLGVAIQGTPAAADGGENSHKLQTQGYARRVLYPWNMHEPNRKASETVALLNERLETVAPDLEVRAVALPALHGDTSNTDQVSIQLGLFAKRDLHPGETILRESSLLTATNRLHDDLCDACNGPLPDLSASNNPNHTRSDNTNTPVACQSCDDIIFCSQTCHDQAQEIYHAAICGQEGLESIGKDVADPADKADYLYFLLLARAIAMAATQDTHPLELPEIKYIWGDFHEYNETAFNSNDNKSSNDNHNENERKYGDDDSSLPFSFQLSILQPMRLLEEMGLDPFTTLDKYDTWILNTLYAKFRGTASGRLSTWDGGPEVCAVHPLWCLANHSCDPNVRWEWGGEICFVVRKTDERAVWSKEGVEKREEKVDNVSIRENEEILNHYCDIGLDVGQRRDWARGALGGLCRCARCQWEADEVVSCI